MTTQLTCRACGKPIDGPDCGLPVCRTCPLTPELQDIQDAALETMDIRHDRHEAQWPGEQTECGQPGACV